MIRIGLAAAAGILLCTALAGASGAPKTTALLATPIPAGLQLAACTTTTWWSCLWTDPDGRKGSCSTSKPRGAPPWTCSCGSHKGQKIGVSSSSC